MEENPNWQDANAEYWREHPEERPITFDERGRETIWWYLFALPLIWLFCLLHLLICVTLMIFVHPESRRYKIYEYYARWGWGKRSNMPYSETQAEFDAKS